MKLLGHYTTIMFNNNLRFSNIYNLNVKSQQSWFRSPDQKAALSSNKKLTLLYMVFLTPETNTESAALLYPDVPF